MAPVSNLANRPTKLRSSRSSGKPASALLNDCRELFESKPWLTHALAWLILGAVSFLQSPGLTVADTKHDLVAAPRRFLSGALNAWTDLFPLGQLQNQAYGYLFPQGFFFLLTDPLPNWVAQRLWWTLVLGVGFSGFYLLVQRLGVGSRFFQLIAAALFALSPRTLTTIGAISSETWPIMLTPWILLPLLGISKNPRPLGRIAASVLAVACLGAVNATATIAACLPAGLFLLFDALRSPRRSLKPLLLWGGGTLAVSAWWLGPLFVLGAYSAPFTDYIESSFVTTRWLNLVEILRGTTSWAPFADAEREAGHLLVSSPYFVLFSCAIAALGLAGLCGKIPYRTYWISLLLIGIGILGAAHGPFGDQVLEFLDGAGAPFRNVHKFDALVHLPICVGIAALGHHGRTIGRLGEDGRRKAAFALLVLTALGATSPAWSGRLAPMGAYKQVPSYWKETADWLNANAQGTRTMVLPAVSFARQEWGWTRDEPLQPLLDVPWVIRDAVPLVDPEAIRGLDGTLAVIEKEANWSALDRLGVGIVVIRHDLADEDAQESADELLDQAEEQSYAIHHFDEVDVVEIDKQRNMRISDQLIPVAGGGESLALLDSLGFRDSFYDLGATDPSIVTDTPLLAARHYGSIRDAYSAPLASEHEGSDVRNAVKDYPSASPPVKVQELGGKVSASSSAADATSFGGSQPAHSLTAAVDKDPDTSWRPTPGTQRGQWLQIDTETTDPIVTITVTEPVDVTVTAGSAEITKHLGEDEATDFKLPSGKVSSIRATLGASKEPAGISEISVSGSNVERIVTLPEAPASAKMFLFQREFIDTGVIIREFSTTRNLQLEVNATCEEDSSDESSEELLLDDHPYTCGDLIDLPAGTHRLSSTARWVALTEPGFKSSTSSAVGDNIEASDKDRYLDTRRSFNHGLRASVGGHELTPIRINAGSQGFVIPAGISGPFEMTFVGDRPYRLSLGIGALLWILTVAGCLVAVMRRRQAPSAVDGEASENPVLVVILTPIVLGIVAGLPGLAVTAVAWAICRWTLIRPSWLAAAAMAIAGIWLARAPWTSGNYTGDAWFLTIMCGLAVASVGVAQLCAGSAHGASLKERERTDEPDPR